MSNHDDGIFMPQLTFPSIAVIGAGTMGAGIAQVCAQAGCAVTLFEASPDVTKRAQKSIESDLKKGVELGKLSKTQEQETLEGIKYAMILQECAGCSLVIEAITEKLDVKQELFARLDSMFPPPVVLATNTSSLSVTAIAGKLRFPDRVVGLHFFNPATRMKLIEVVQAHQTSLDVVERSLNFCREIGKEAVKVQDSPGFIVNRCARPFYGEALRCLGEGIADVQVIDRIMKEGGDFKMGPFELMDLIGIDINYAATRSIWEGYFHDARYRPHLIQKRMMDAGYLGRKTGHGFYEYPDDH